jgi:hypothetical protein
MLYGVERFPAPTDENAGSSPVRLTDTTPSPSVISGLARTPCAKINRQKLFNTFGTGYIAFVCHPDDRGRALESKEARLGAFDDFNGDLVPLEAKLIQSGLDGLVFAFSRYLD